MKHCPICKTGVVQKQRNGRIECKSCGYLLPNLKCASCVSRRRVFTTKPCIDCIFTKHHPFYRIDPELANSILEDFGATYDSENQPDPMP